MTTNTGTLVIAPIDTYDSADGFPTHKALKGQGGLRTWPTFATLNQIPAARLEEGMVVYCQDTKTYYQLSADLVTWVAQLGDSPIPANTILGNNTVNPATPIALTVPQVKAELGYVLASSDFVNQGAVAQVLHGNAVGNPSWGPVALGDQANLAANSLVGNNTGAPATPLALTPPQVNALLTTVVQIANIAALRAITWTPYAGQQVNVTEYFAGSGQGGGGFAWNSTSTAADNGGSVIQVTGVATGRWIGTDTTFANIKRFGAKGDAATDDTAAIASALATGLSLYVPKGTYLVSSSLSVATQGQCIFGVGFLQSIFRRATDTTFVMFNVTSTSGNSFVDVRFEDVSGFPTFTNTGSFVQLPIGGGTDVNFTRCWFRYGWIQVLCLAGTSNIVFQNCIFEASRKGAISSSSSGRNVVSSCIFWKNSGDNSNPSDRGYAISFAKNGGYAFGSFNWNINGNYFAENVYGPFILSNTSQGLQIVGNFFEIPSQVDNGQRSDIQLTNDTQVEIAGNVSNSVVNSYIAGQRGAKYCVDLSGGGCTNIVIAGNNYQAGVAGTINDPGNVATVYGVPGYNDAVSIALPLQINGSGTGITMSAQTGTLNKSGRMISFSATTTLTSKGASTGAARLGPLPFIPASIAYGSGFISGTSGITTPIFFQINTDGFVYPLWSISTNVLDSNIGNTSSFNFSGSYQV